MTRCDILEVILKLSCWKKKRDPFKNCRVFEIFPMPLVGGLSSPLTLYIHPSIHFPFVSRLPPSLSYSRARGTLTHSSSTPVDSTTIQSRSTRHAASFVGYACVSSYLFFPFCLYLPFLSLPSFSPSHLLVLSHVYNLSFSFYFSALFFDFVSSQSSYRSLRKITRSWKTTRFLLTLWLVRRENFNLRIEFRFIFLHGERKTENREGKRKRKREKDKCFRALAKLTLRIEAVGSKFGPVCRQT